MTKIYCTVAIKLYYRQIERFWCLGDELPASRNETSVTAHQWYLPLDGVYQNKLSCGEIMDATFTDFTNIHKLSSCCVSCIFGPLTLVKGMSYKSTTKCFFFFYSETSTCTTADHFKSFNPVCLPNCQYCIFFSLPFPLASFVSPSLKWPPHDFAITTKRPTTLPEPVWSLMLAGPWLGSPCEAALA